MWKKEFPIKYGLFLLGILQGNRGSKGRKNWLSVGQCGLVRRRVDHTCARIVIVRTNLVLSLIFLINEIDSQGFEK